MTKDQSLETYAGFHPAWRNAFIFFTIAVASVYLTGGILLLATIPPFLPGGGWSIIILNYPLIGTVIHILGTIFFALWLCAIVVFGTTHPVHREQVWRWLVVSVITSLNLAITWIAFSWIPTVPPTYTTDYSWLFPALSSIMANVGFVALIIVPSIVSWYTWLKPLHKE